MIGHRIRPDFLGNVSGNEWRTRWNPLFVSYSIFFFLAAVAEFCWPPLYLSEPSFIARTLGGRWESPLRLESSEFHGIFSRFLSRTLSRRPVRWGELARSRDPSRRAKPEPPNPINPMAASSGLFDRLVGRPVGRSPPPPPPLLDRCLPTRRGQCDAHTHTHTLSRREKRRK